ncbi:MAG TPA: hypothetical protein PLJ47_16485 [Candidatus Hydrogenedentes bacterium]|nr:hypothetical protein [Candidatus Hydrogenedentota bacterium]
MIRLTGSAPRGKGCATPHPVRHSWRWLQNLLVAVPIFRALQYAHAADGNFEWVMQFGVSDCYVVAVGWSK